MPILNLKGKNLEKAASREIKVGSILHSRMDNMIDDETEAECIN